MLVSFVCALLGFCLRKFPAKSENNLDIYRCLKAVCALASAGPSYQFCLYVIPPQMVTVGEGMGEGGVIHTDTMPTKYATLSSSFSYLL